jgi:uncharacterized damage-inducible protein DinB
VIDRDDTPATWDERATLLAMLDYARATAVAKCAGLSDEGARKAPIPTSPLMTVAGVLNHVRWVEHGWIEVEFLGGEDRAPWTEDAPDREFEVALDVPLAQIVEEYEGQCERLRAIVADHDLDERAAKPIDTGEHPTLRWVLFHLVEETSRHNGHLDLLRELADGATGT